jgi:hypothetical protein
MESALEAAAHAECGACPLACGAELTQPETVRAD